MIKWLTNFQEYKWPPKYQWQQCEFVQIVSSDKDGIHYINRTWSAGLVRLVQYLK